MISRSIHSPKYRTCGGYRSAARVRGLSLIEVSISVLVTSVGLLGMAALHMTSLRSSYEASSRLQASTLASDIADRMRSNRVATLSGAYDIEVGKIPSQLESAAQIDIAEWKSSLKQQLQNGDGSVAVRSVNQDAVVTITIIWKSRSVGTTSSTITTTI